MLFDAPPQMKFREASRQGRDCDMSQIFSGTLVKLRPFPCRHLVTNHDTHAAAGPSRRRVEPWFKPLAYALILAAGEWRPRSLRRSLRRFRQRIPGGDGETRMPLRCPLSNNPRADRRPSALFAHGVKPFGSDHPNCTPLVVAVLDDDPGCVGDQRPMAMRAKRRRRWAETMATNAGGIFSVTGKRLSKPPMGEGCVTLLCKRGA